MHGQNMQICTVIKPIAYFLSQLELIKLALM